MAITLVDAVQGSGEAAYLGFVKVNEIITKINAIEAAATADQSGAEIKVLLEALADKLSIELGVKETATKKVMTSIERAKLAVIDLSDGIWNQQFNNLLKNGSFESWSAGAAVAPDGWTLAGAGAAIARGTTIIRFGEYSAKINRNGNDCNLYQRCFDIDADTNTYWRGRTVTLGCWVYAMVADRARIRVGDGVASVNSSFHSGGSSWEFLTATITLNAAATRLQAYFFVVTGDTFVYFDGAILVEGTICPTFCQHPNDEHLKAIDYQDATPTNYDYSLLRMECGYLQLAGNAGANVVNLNITFGTAFTKILSCVVSGVKFLGGDNVIWVSDVETTANFRVRAFTVDAANFANTDTGDAMWIAIGVGP